MRTSETSKLYVPFYRLYTPYDIRTKAEFTSRYTSYTSTEILYTTSGTTYNERLFRLPLIPGDILSRYADVIAVITIGLDKEKRSSDSDPYFFLSDGINGIGFEVRDNPYCRGVQGIMGDVLGSRSRTSTPSVHQSSVHPEQFTMTIKPSRRWGSCYSAGDSGIISPASYTRNIYSDQGLWLEVYRENTGELYSFNYIKVEIHEN